MILEINHRCQLTIHTDTDSLTSHSSKQQRRCLNQKSPCIVNLQWNQYSSIFSFCPLARG